MVDKVKGPRDAITEELVRRARTDPAFRTQLVTDPRATVERKLGVKLPARLAIHVHEETPDALHLVLPLATVTFDEAILRRVELGDREVAGYADKGDPIYINTARRG